jgi:hypothetical protein
VTDRITHCDPTDGSHANRSRAMPISAGLASRPRWDSERLIGAASVSGEAENRGQRLVNAPLFFGAQVATEISEP